MSLSPYHDSDDIKCTRSIWTDFSSITHTTPFSPPHTPKYTSLHEPLLTHIEEDEEEEHHLRIQIPITPAHYHVTRLITSTSSNSIPASSSCTALSMLVESNSPACDVETRTRSQTSTSTSTSTFPLLRIPSRNEIATSTSSLSQRYTSESTPTPTSSPIKQSHPYIHHITTISTIFDDIIDIDMLSHLLSTSFLRIQLLLSCMMIISSIASINPILFFAITINHIMMILWDCFMSSCIHTRWVYILHRCTSICMISYVFITYDDVIRYQDALHMIYLITTLIVCVHHLIHHIISHTHICDMYRLPINIIHSQHEMYLETHIQNDSINIRYASHPPSRTSYVWMMLMIAIIASIPWFIITSYHIYITIPCIFIFCGITCMELSSYFDIKMASHLIRQWDYQWMMMLMMMLITYHYQYTSHISVMTCLILQCITLSWDIFPAYSTSRARYIHITSFLLHLPILITSHHPSIHLLHLFFICLQIRAIVMSYGTIRERVTPHDDIMSPHPHPHSHSHPLTNPILPTLLKRCHSSASTTPEAHMQPIRLTASVSAPVIHTLQAHPHPIVTSHSDPALNHTRNLIIIEHIIPCLYLSLPISTSIRIHESIPYDPAGLTPSPLVLPRGMVGKRGFGNDEMEKDQDITPSSAFARTCGFA